MSFNGEDRSATDVKVSQMIKGVSSKLKKWDRPIFGYTPEPEVKRKDGEVWEDDDGKTWTMKNGVKQSISKLQSAKMPWWCPKCSRSMSHKLDTKFYRLYNQCYDCTITQHSKMMVDGVWEEFEKNTIRANEKAFLQDMIVERQEYIRTFTVPQAHYTNGTWELLAKKAHFTLMFAEIEKDIQFCKNRLLQIEKEEEEESKISSTQ